MWTEATVTTDVLALTRGFERTRAATSEERAAYDTDASDKRYNTTSDKTTCPLQWTEHGTLRPCANFWRAASTYSMEEKPTRTCSKKTHTQRHGTLVVYTQVSSSSQLSQAITREMSHRAGSKRPGSQTVTKKTQSHDGLHRSRSTGISVSRR